MNNVYMSDLYVSCVVVRIIIVEKCKSHFYPTADRIRSAELEVLHSTCRYKSRLALQDSTSVLCLYPVIYMIIDNLLCNEAVCVSSTVRVVSKYSQLKRISTRALTCFSTQTRLNAMFCYFVRSLRIDKKSLVFYIQI